jgi:hypothetical protein
MGQQQSNPVEEKSNSFPKGNDINATCGGDIRQEKEEIVASIMTIV